MKIILDRNKLFKAVSTAYLQNNTLNIYESLKVNIKDKYISFAGFDGDIVTEYILECEANNDICFMLCGKVFVDILKNMPNGDLEIVVKDKQLEIKSLSDIKALFKIQIARNKDNELFYVKDMPKDCIEIDLNIYKKLFKSILNFTSVEDARYFLQGIFFKKEGNTLLTVATDGRRLAKQTYLLESKDDYNDFEHMLPKKTVNYILNHYSGGNIKIAFDDNKMLISDGILTINSNLMETSFPDYNRVIPEDIDYNIECDTKSLYNTVRRVSSILDKNQVRLKLVFNNDTINIYCESDMGNSSESITCDSNIKDIPIGINYHYLLDTLSNIDSDHIFMYVKSSIDPIVISSDKSIENIFVVGPMRLDG